MEAIMILPILVRCTFEAVLLNFFRFTLQCDVLVVLARNRSVSLTKRPQQQQQQQNKVIKNHFAILQLWCWRKLSVCVRAMGSLELTVSPIIFYLISVIDRPCIFFYQNHCLHMKANRSQIVGNYQVHVIWVNTHREESSKHTQTQRLDTRIGHCEVNCAQEKAKTMFPNEMCWNGKKSERWTAYEDERVQQEPLSDKKERQRRE